VAPQGRRDSQAVTPAALRGAKASAAGKRRRRQRRQRDAVGSFTSCGSPVVEPAERRAGVVPRI